MTRISHHIGLYRCRRLDSIAAGRNSTPIILAIFDTAYSVLLENWTIFTARRVCIARICRDKMSVCLFVCHTLVLCLNRYRYPQFFFTILVFPYQTEWRYSDGTPPPPNGGVECKGYDKMTISSLISPPISETVIVRWAHAATICKHRILFPSTIHTTFSVIAPGASPRETKMW